MTQAFNLGQFGNKVNTSGQADLTTAVTGTLPVTNLPTVTVPYGGTGLTTLTANNVILGNGVSTPNFVAPGTNGNLLTSNGTTWTSAAAPASGGMTLLGTITPTVVNSISLGSLVLTSYKQVQIVINSVAGTGTAGSGFTFSSDNNQTQVNVTNAGKTTRGIATIDLGTGMIGAGVITTSGGTISTAVAGGSCNIATSSTTIYIRETNTNTFDAVGSFVIYGVK